MEVKVGIQMAPRELIVETSMTAEEIEQALGDALADDRVFMLSDNKGKTVLVPSGKIAYVELSMGEQRKVGFGSR
ncbi:MAG TPA: DUF3107 domain-containing protein [Streptosporangiaceae bacterium]|nr:DUF3107 domain-containing protein [Streptosporangiaceae bacterium]